MGNTVDGRNPKQPETYKAFGNKGTYLASSTGDRRIYSINSIMIQKPNLQPLTPSWPASRRVPERRKWRLQHPQWKHDHAWRSETKLDDTSHCFA